jgi:hypothetical protein
MGKNVNAWLLVKARSELKAARGEVAEAARMVKEYQRRVVDPTWSQYTFPGEGPRDPKCPGKAIWGPKVTEWKRYLTKSKKKVAWLEKVVEGLS